MKQAYHLLLAVAFLALFASNAFAQSTANYAFSFSNTGSLVDMSTGTTDIFPVGTYRDDVASAVTNIGFSFTLMGVNYTQFSINSNGQLRLGSTVISGTAASVAAGVPLIAPMGGDNAIQATGKVHYKVLGSPGTQQLVVEWNDLIIPFTSTPGLGSVVQAVLSESGGVIEFRYGTVNNNSASSASRAIFFSSSNVINTVGSVTVGATPTYSTAASPVSNTFAAGPGTVANLSSAADGARWVYTFTPPVGVPAAPTNLTFTSVGRGTITVNWVDNSTNEAFFTVSRATAVGGPFTVIESVPTTTSGTTGSPYSSLQTGLSPGTTYYFRITAAHEGAASGDLSGSQSTDAVSIFSGSYTINPNAPNSGTNYTTWTEAFTLLNTLGVAGPTTFTVTGTASTVAFSEGNLTLGGAYVSGVPQSALLTTLSATNTLTFVAGTGKTINMSGTGVSGTIDFVFRLQGVDYVTFDGINILDVGATATTQFEFGYIIVNASNSDGATNNTIKNFSATLVKTNTGQANGPYGVLVQNGTTLVSSLGTAGTYASRNNNNKIQNFTINGAKRGISFSGLAIPSFDEGNEVSGPAFTSATGGIWIGGSRITNGGGSTAGTDWGVGIDGQKNLKVFNVQIDNFVETSASPALSGIHFGTAASTAVGADNTEIFNCVIHDFQNNLSTTTGVMGIRSSGSAPVTTKIYNTAIYDLRATAATGANVVVGIQLTSTGAGSRFELYNNSIYLPGILAAAGTSKGMGFSPTVANGIVVIAKNNAISFGADGGGSAGGAAAIDFGGVSATLIDFSNNLYFAGTTSAARRVANYPSTVRQNLVDWQSALSTPSDGVDQRSGYGDPGFNGASDLTYGVANSVNDGGTPISGLSTANDILGVARSITNPDIGVFEGNFSSGFADASKPGIAITPLDGSVSSEVRVLITDNVNTPGNLIARLWYRGTPFTGAFTALPPDAAPVNSNNGEYRWGASLRALPPGTYQYYIVVRDAAGNSYADPTMTPGATSPGFTTTGDPDWNTASPFASAGVKTFQNGGSVLAGGTYSVGPTGAYPSLTAVAAEVNTKPLAGSVVFELQSTYTGAGEVYPIVFNQPAYTVAGPVTITVRPASGTASPLITAGNPGGSNPLIFLDGMRDLILDGRPGGIGASRMWIIRNNKDSAAINASGEAIRLVNDALRNTFRYLILEANTTTNLGGVINIGATFSGGQGNNFNVIDNCDIGPYTSATLAAPPNPVRGIATGGGTFVYNKNNTYSNNLIHDFHNTVSNPIGISLSGEVGATITGNSIYQTVPRSGWAAFGLGIVVGAANGPGPTITDNYIGGSAPLCGGEPMTISATTTVFYAMQLTLGMFTSPTVISGNMMTNWNLTTSNTTASSIVGCGINFAATNGTNQMPVSVRNNTIGSFLSDATVSPAITLTSASTGAPSVFSGYFASAGGVLSIAGNSIGGIKLSSTAAGTTGFIGIQQQTNGIVAKIDSNLIGSTTVTNSIVQSTNAAVSGIVQTSTVVGNPSISHNTVANVLFDASVAGASQTFTGISCAGTAPPSIVGNTIRNISGNNHAGATGISMTSSGLGTVIRGNVVRNIAINPQTPTTSLTVQGMQISSSTSTGNVVGNLIHSLVNGSTSTSAVLRGIQNNFGANWTYINNIISIGEGSDGDIVVRGFDDFSDAPSTGAGNFYFNTVRIGGNVPSGTINTSAWYRSTSSTPQTLRNNIFVNLRVGPASPNRHFAISNVTSTTGWTATASNYNVFKTNSDTVAQWLSTTPTGSRTLAGWKAAQTGGSGGDANSIEKSVTFVDDATNLHLSGPSIGDYDLAGLPITGITTDFDNETRDTQAPYRGADEVVGSPLPVQLASFTGRVNPNGSGILLEWRTISEINNYGFYVERRSENEQQFVEVPNSFVPGHGTTNEPRNYSFTDNTLTASGLYYYRLRQQDLSGAIHRTEPIMVSYILTSVPEAAPKVFALFQNYPNPFNPSTEIKFSVEKTDRATLEVYSLLGQKVATLFDGIAEAGQYYRIRLNADQLATGMYLYRLQSGTKNDLKKMLLLK